METTRPRTVAFSGHRSFKTGGRSFDQLPSILREQLSTLVGQGYHTFLCGMAEGFDLLAAREVLRLKAEHPHIRLVAALPHPGQADRFPRAAAEEWRGLLERADRIETVCPGYSPDCYHRRNDWMLERASVLVCFYNGSSGGTRYCVERAARRGLRVVNLCPGGMAATMGSLFRQEEL